jgi:hypothetical protein
MRLFSCIALSLLLAAACSASPAPASAPTPTVAIAPPPPEPSAAQSAEPDATADAPEPSDPSGLDCDTALDQAKAEAHKTLDDCEEMRQRIVSVLQACQPDVDSVAWGFLHSADCMQDVIDDQVAGLKGKMSASDAAAQAKAGNDFRSALQTYCTRDDCSMSYGAHCTVGLLSCQSAVLGQAAAGTLAFGAGQSGAAQKVEKEVKVFTDYAKAVCALPASAWKDHKAPAGCADQVLRWLSDCPGPKIGCSGP